MKNIAIIGAGFSAASLSNFIKKDLDIKHQPTINNKFGKIYNTLHELWKYR